MPTTPSKTKTATAAKPAPDTLPRMLDDMNPFLQASGSVGEYVVDAAQRTILFWDVLRQRSDQYYAQKEKAIPHVLSFDAELVLDARSFERPANYLMLSLIHI